jgi:hypothetical protein
MRVLGWLAGVLGGLLVVGLVGVAVDKWWQFKKLKDPNPTARIEVIDELSNVFCSDSDAVGALINLVRDKDTNVRAHAVQGLGKCKDASAIEPLIIALKSDPDPVVRKNASEALHQFTDPRATEALELIAAPQTAAPLTTVAEAPPGSAPTIDIGDPNLAVDCNLPPGTLRGQTLKDYHESMLRQDEGPYASDVRAVEEARTDEFAAVAATIDHVYEGLDRMKQAAFAPEYEATKRDLDRLREFAVNTCTFPVSAEIVRRATGNTDLKDPGYMSTIIVGQKQIDMWHQGMMSWGVYYDITKAGCWPTDMLTEPPNQISEGGQRIYKGDWRGAWLLNRGRVYVPGIAFFLSTELEVHGGQALNGLVSPNAGTGTTTSGNDFAKKKWTCTATGDIADFSQSQQEQVAEVREIVASHLSEVEGLDDVIDREAAQDDKRPIGMSKALIIDSGHLRPVGDDDRSLAPNHFMLLEYQRDLVHHTSTLVAFESEASRREVFSCAK